MNEITVRRLVAGSMFLLPIVLIKVTAFLSGGPAPAQSNAALVTVAIDPALLTTKRQPMSDDQISALKHIRWLEDQPYGDAPLHYDQPPQGPAQPKTRVGRFALNAILVTRGVETAVINGQLYRLGDRVGDTSWRVGEINNTTMQVVLKRSTGDGDITRVITMQD